MQSFCKVCDKHSIVYYNIHYTRVYYILDLEMIFKNED